LEESWIESCAEHNVKVSPDYSLIKTLGDPVEIRDWHMSGLPSDTISTESGIIVLKSSRWPLIIDPQMQANNWIKKLFGIKTGQIPKTPEARSIRSSRSISKA
jgi:dynein heavy chain, axonemal